MSSSPLIQRELRMALRRLKPEQRRFRTAAWVVGASSAGLLIARLFGVSSMSELFQWGLLVYGISAVLGAPRRVAGFIAEERSGGNLELLFLSGVGPLDVFVGKLASALLIGLQDLLIIVPLLALPFLMGGCSLSTFIASLCYLPGLLVFTVALSLLASSLASDEGAAFSLTLVLALVICGMPMAAWTVMRWFGAAAAPPDWLAISPAYGAYRLFTRGVDGGSHSFWASWWLMLGWAASLLVLTAEALHRRWRSTRRTSSSEAWRSFWQRSVQGTRRSYARLAKRWLDVQPMTWLELRNRRPLLLAWFSVISLMVVWMVGWVLWPMRWPTAPNFFITISLLNFVIGIFQDGSTARFFAGARRDRAFELLLTTPIDVGELVHDHFAARRHQFRALFASLLGLEVVMMWAGLVLRPWTGNPLITYFIIWVALAVWTSIACGFVLPNVGTAWAAMNAGRPHFGPWRRRSFRVFWLCYCCWIFGRSVGNIDTFPSGSTGELILVVGLGLVGLLFFIAVKRQRSEQMQKLIAQFREIMQEPIPHPDDPRFAQWKQPTRDRFPWPKAYPSLPAHGGEYQR